VYYLTYRLLEYGIALSAFGAALLLWHGFNMLRPQPQSNIDFVAIRRSESAWAVLIGVALIGIGVWLIRLYLHRMHGMQ